MRDAIIDLGLGLVAIGSLLPWAVDAAGWGVDVRAVGVALVAIGVAAVGLSLAGVLADRSHSRDTEDRTGGQQEHARPRRRLPHK